MQCRLEWPCLSVDVLVDDLGDSRVAFPHSLAFVAGTQAERSTQNTLTVVRLTQLKSTRKIRAEGEESDEDESDDESDDEEEGASKGAVMQTRRARQKKPTSVRAMRCKDWLPSRPHLSRLACLNLRTARVSRFASLFPIQRCQFLIPAPTRTGRSVVHPGGVNRVRSMPQHPHVVATWADSGHVIMHDISKELQAIGSEPAVAASAAAQSSKPAVRAVPRQVFGGHRGEGRAGIKKNSQKE